jgi:hypothetical protein
MRTFQFVAACCVGFLLYLLPVVYVGGFLAATPIPAGYFRLFAQEYAGFGHLLLGLALHVLPTALLVAGGVLAAERVWPQRGHRKWPPYAMGMLACLLVLELLLPSGCLHSQETQSSCARAAVQRFVSVPWWAVPVGFPLGSVLALPHGFSTATIPGPSTVWPNPSLNRRPTPAGSVRLVRGTWCIISYQPYAAYLRGRR